MFARFIENFVEWWTEPVSREAIEQSWIRRQLVNDPLPPGHLRVRAGMLLPHEQAAQRKQAQKIAQKFAARGRGHC